MPLIKTVFGYSPLPQSLKDPKSLYQSPSGADGSDLTHDCRRRRSASRIWRSATRARRCCQRPRGRSENRIFGNCVFPENSPNQVLSSFLFLPSVLLFQEPSVGGLKIVFGFFLGSDSSLRQSNQGAADREVTFLGNAAHLNRQWRRNRHTLTHSPGPGPRGDGLGLTRHALIVVSRVHHCGSVAGWRRSNRWPDPTCSVDRWWGRDLATGIPGAAVNFTVWAKSVKLT